MIHFFQEKRDIQDEKKSLIYYEFFVNAFHIINRTQNIFIAITSKINKKMLNFFCICSIIIALE